jgi:transmembrane sensor
MDSDSFRHLLVKYINGKCTPEEVTKIVKVITTKKGRAIFEEVDEVFWSMYRHTDSMSTDTLKFDEEIKRILGVAEKKNVTSKRSVIRFMSSRMARIAAIFIAVAIVSFVLMNVLKENSPKKDSILPVTYVENIAEFGFKNNVSLRDGSTVLLNSTSHLSVPSNYSSTDRQVVLNGEAFFSIAKDSLHPFKVNTSDLQIAVLGTSFNVRSFKNESIIVVTVVTGKVAVSTGNRNEKVYVTPYKQLILNKSSGDYQIKELKDLSVINWKNDVIQVNKTSMEEFAKIIESYYNIKVEIQGEAIKGVTLTGVHQNKSLWSILESLKFVAGISYKQQGEILILYK